MKKIILFFCLIICATNAQAYWWRFNNFTQKILLLKVKLLASNNPYYAIALPNQSVLFDWSPPNPMAGFCLEKIEWMEPSSSILSNKDLVDEDYSIVSNDKINELFFGQQAPFTLNKAPINYVSTDIYKKTVEHAGSIFGKKLMKWAASVYAKSACKSRHITIIENDKDEIEFLTQKN